MNLNIEYHRGLCAITDDQIAYTCHEILDQNQVPLLVSHGEVYRILLRILSIQTDINKAQNAGLYLFKPSYLNDKKWFIKAL
jgi:hypothetical protein